MEHVQSFVSKYGLIKDYPMELEQTNKDQISVEVGKIYKSNRIIIL